MEDYKYLKPQEASFNFELSGNVSVVYKYKLVIGKGYANSKQSDPVPYS